MFYELFYLAVCILIGGMVMSHRFKDGVVVKVGLIIVSLGFFGASATVIEHPDILYRAVSTIALGAVICVAGFCVRHVCTRGRCHRFSDWMDVG